MKKNYAFLSIIALFCFNTSFAQTRILLEKIAQTGPDSFDVLLTSENLPEGTVMYRTFNLIGDSAEIVQNGDTLHDFYPAQHLVDAFVSDYYLLSARIQPDNVNFPYTINSYVPPTDEVSMDGSLTITFSDTVPDSIFYVWNRLNGLEYPTSTTDQKTYTINNLNYGAYIFDIYVDHIDPTYHLSQFHIAVGDVGVYFPSPVLFMGINPSLTVYEATNGCNAVYSYSPYDAVGNVTYKWSPNANAGDTNTVSRLCSDYYLLSVEDEAGKKNLISIMINERKTFQFGYQIGDSIASDTITEWKTFENWSCLLDLSEPMDSVKSTITSSYVMDGYEIAFLKFTFFQGTDSVEFESAIGHDSLNNFPYLVLNLYCIQQPRTSYISRSNHFPSERPAFIRNSNLTGAEELQLFPNPAKDRIYLTDPTSQGSIYDSSGKLILRYENGTAEISHLKEGVYFVKPDNTSKTLRFIQLR